MLPGGGMNPRQMAAMMKKLGIDVREVDAEEVIVRTATTEYVFRAPSVSIMRAQGTETWQISGKPEQRERKVELAIGEDDVAVVAEQTGRSKEEARRALEASNGDLAEAILKLSEGGGGDDA